MLSFHNVQSIILTEAKSHGSGFTNELIIDAGDRVYQIDFFSKSRNALRLHDETFKTLKMLIKELVETDAVNDN